MIIKKYLSDTSDFTFEVQKEDEFEALLDFKYKDELVCTAEYTNTMGGFFSLDCVHVDYMKKALIELSNFISDESTTFDKDILSDFEFEKKDNKTFFLFDTEEFAFIEDDNLIIIDELYLSRLLMTISFCS